MAVGEGQVSFVAISTVATAAAFTEAVGVQPTFTTEVGGPRGNGRSGRRSEVALWTLDREFDGGVNPVDEALVALLSAFDGAEERLDAVRDSYELRVSWWGTSNSEQGGFWFSLPVVQRTARLGAEVHGTVYFDAADKT